MNFDLYQDKIKQLLLLKARNNPDREAIIKLSEVDISIQITDDLTRSFASWLKRDEMISDACFFGKGCVKCIIKEKFI